MDGWESKSRGYKCKSKPQLKGKIKAQIKARVTETVQETELFKHVDKLLSCVSYEDKKPYVAAKVCYEADDILLRNEAEEILLRNEVDESRCQKTCVECIKGLGEEKVTAFANPSSNDVLTALLMALPLETWSCIKDHSLWLEMKQLISMASLPTLLQQEVLHLRSQLESAKTKSED